MHAATKKRACQPSGVASALTSVERMMEKSGNILMLRVPIQIAHGRHELTHGHAAQRHLSTNSRRLFRSAKILPTASERRAFRAEARASRAGPVGPVIGIGGTGPGQNAAVASLSHASPSPALKPFATSAILGGDIVLHKYVLHCGRAAARRSCTMSGVHSRRCYWHSCEARP